MTSDTRWERVASVYNPLQAGSIDGTDNRPHDKAIEKAMKAIYKPPENLAGDPECTLFIGRLDFSTTEHTLSEIFSKYGDIERLRLVRDIVTGTSKQFAFIEYSKQRYAVRAKRDANHTNVDGRDILVDWECERTLPKWIPRRLGGGFGGKKESGQLRFGGNDRPFRKPIVLRKQDDDDRDREQDRGRHYDRRGETDAHRDRSSRHYERGRGDDTRSDRNREGRHRDRYHDRHETRSPQRDREMEGERRRGARHRGEDSERKHSVIDTVIKTEPTDTDTDKLQDTVRIKLERD